MTKSAERLHHDHKRAQREHAAWKQDLERWREEFLEAVMLFARRMNSDLDLDGYQEDIALHESALAIAIDIHEEAVERHEGALDLEERGAQGASEDFDELHLELDSRHADARSRHRRLDGRHMAILAALEGAERP